MEQPKLQAHALPIELLSRICCMSYSLHARHLYSLLMKQMLDVGNQNDFAILLEKIKKKLLDSLNSVTCHSEPSLCDDDRDLAVAQADW